MILVATDMGFPLYQSFGFETAFNVMRMTMKNEMLTALRDSPVKLYNPRLPSDEEVNRVRRQYFKDIVAFDAALMGANREGVYNALWTQGVRGNVIYHQNRLAGFILYFRRGERIVVSAFQAMSESVALDLLDNVFRGLLDEPAPFSQVRIDVPAQQSSFLSTLQSLGFERDQVSPFMVFGQAGPTGYTEGIYGLLDPALG